MARKPRYIREYKDRHGVTRLEFRRKGYKGWALRQPLRSADFWEDYEAALKGETPAGVLLRNSQRPTPPAPIRAKSLRWLVNEYRMSPAFKTLAQSTRTVRANTLDRLCEAYGDFPYATLTAEAVMKIRNAKMETPEAANTIVKALRQVYRHAVEYNIEGITHDPTREVKLLPSKNPDGFHAWTIDEVAQYRERHPIGSKARLALELCLFGGCARRSDLVRLGRQHITRDGRLRYTQQKNRHKKPIEVDIPILPELHEAIDATPTGDMTFLITEFNLPFSAKGFGNWFKKRAREAGLEECSTHGMRKVGAEILAESGCTDHEIMAIGGWTTLKEVQRYSKKARRRVMADNASRKIADTSRTKLSNRPGSGG